MAYKLRERVSDRERFMIEGQYYDYVTGELDRSVQSYEMWLAGLSKGLFIRSHQFGPRLH